MFRPWRGVAQRARGPAEPKHAYAAFERACKLDVAGGCTAQGLALDHGEGVAADPRRALAFLEQACSKDGHECDALALAYKDRRGVAVDLVRTRALYAQTHARKRRDQQAGGSRTARIQRLGRAMIRYATCFFQEQTSRRRCRMAHRKTDHTLVVGAGPVGLAAALFLRERGIEVEIVDGSWAPRTDKLSVVLHPDTLARLEDAGVELDLADEAAAIDTVAIYDRGARVAALDLRDSPSGFGYAAVVPCWRLCDKLVHQLRDRHVAVQWRHRLGNIEASRDRVIANVDVIDSEPTGYVVAHEEHMVRRILRREPPFLIGADGADSLVRGQLELPWRTLAPPELIAVFEVDGGPPLGREIRIALGEATVALWPLAGGGTRIALQLPPSERLDARVAAGTAPDADDLARLVARYLPDLGTPLGELRQGQLERMPVGIAARPSTSTVWLLGAAANALPLGASLGLNSSVRAAHDLASALGRVLREHASPELLSRQADSEDNATVREADLGGGYVPGERCAPAIGSGYRQVLPLLPVSGADRDRVARQLGLFPAPVSTSPTGDARTRSG